MSLIRTSGPAVEPVSRDEAKRHLDITTADDDTKIDELIASARAIVESRTRRALITQTYQLTLPEFPDGAILLPRPPLLSVTSIHYQDTSDSQQSVSEGTADGEFRVNSAGALGSVSPVTTWPSTKSNHPNAVTITFVAGYGPAATDVPENILQVMRLLISDLYDEDRPSKARERAIEALLSVVTVTAPEAFTYV